MMENINWLFKKVHIKTCKLSKEKDILVALSFYFLPRTKMYCKKLRKTICLFDKSRNIFYMSKVDLDES